MTCIMRLNSPSLLKGEVVQGHVVRHGVCNTNYLSLLAVNFLSRPSTSSDGLGEARLDVSLLAPSSLVAQARSAFLSRSPNPSSR